MYSRSSNYTCPVIWIGLSNCVQPWPRTNSYLACKQTRVHSIYVTYPPPCLEFVPICIYMLRCTWEDSAILSCSLRCSDTATSGQNERARGSINFSEVLRNESVIPVTLTPVALPMSFTLLQIAQWITQLCEEFLNKRIVYGLIRMEHDIPFHFVTSEKSKRVRW